MRPILSLTRAAILTLSALVTACGGGNGDTEKSKLVAVTPSDPAIASLYNSSCISCHASGYGAAPRSGDVAAWAPRLEKGMSTLVGNAINGFKGMPPLGACIDCTEEDFQALIEFMVKAPDQQTAEGH